MTPVQKKLPMSKARLDRVETWAKIVSALAIPLVLAIGGYFVQRGLTDDGLKKDYVAIAMTILKDPPTNQEPELRAWAVQMVDKNSPIPLTQKVKDSLRDSPLIRPYPYSLEEFKRRQGASGPAGVVGQIIRGAPGPDGTAPLFATEPLPANLFPNKK